MGSAGEEKCLALTVQVQTQKHTRRAFSKEPQIHTNKHE